MNIKYHFETSLGIYKRERTRADIEAQKQYEYHLQAEARRTLTRLRQEGRRVRISYSNSFDVANRGISVMPNPRLTEDGYLAWEVR